MKTKLNLLIAGMFLAVTSSVWAATHYVALDGPKPTPPCTTWATAASISVQQFHQTRFIRRTFCQRLIERCQTASMLPGLCC